MLQDTDLEALAARLAAEAEPGLRDRVQRLRRPTGAVGAADT